MQIIQMNRDQLGALERFFGGYRDRIVTVAQEPGSDRTTFFRGSEPFSGHICAMLSLAEVEAIVVEADAAPSAAITLPGILAA